MSKKRRNRHKKEGQEPQFDFDEAKELTVGQAIRKNEEVEAGVLSEDSILDKYVKQHRDEIEADKFATRQYKKEELVETQSLDDLIQEMREAVEESEAYSEEVPSSEDILPPLPLDDEEQGLDPLLLEDENPTEMTEEVEEEQNLSRLEQEESEKKSKKGFVLTALALVSVIICVSAYYVYRQVNRSTKEIETSQSTTANQSDVDDFNTLYDAFYTDSNKTALKNSQFDKLSQLKTLLDKLEGSREHTLAKSKYDSLATQIKAIQDVNAQFEKPAIVDGVLDTNAKAKSDAKFTDIKTGNTELDKVLDKAISLVRASKQVLLAQVQVKLVAQALVKQAQIRLVRQAQVVQMRLEVVAVKSIWVSRVQGLLFKEVPVVLPIISLLLMIVTTLPGILRMVSWNKF